jgi:phospholipid transport system substrate-binding protein
VAATVMSRRLLLHAGLVAALTQTGVVEAGAAPARDAQSFIETLLHEGLQTVADQQLSDHAREDRFARVLDEDFDFPRIARFVLGYHGSTASEPDRQHFAKVFQQWVIRVYGSRFSGYGGETIEITGTRPDSETTTSVASRVIRPSGAPPIKIDWRVRREGGDDYRVVDVAVEGVSMVLMQREEFAAVIERNGGTVPDLTRALEQKIASGDTGDGFSPGAMAQPSQ